MSRTDVAGFTITDGTNVVFLEFRANNSVVNIAYFFDQRDLGEITTKVLFPDLPKGFVLDEICLTALAARCAIGNARIQIYTRDPDSMKKVIPGLMLFDVLDSIIGLRR